MRKTALAGLLLGALGIAANLLPMDQAQAQGRAAGVVVEAVEIRLFKETSPVLGEFIAPTSSVVASRVPGLIASVSVQVGDQVQKSDLLVQLDTELLEIELRAAQASRREAEAGLTVAEADHGLARQAFERIERLKDSPAFSEGQLNDLERRLQRALGQIEQARARINSADVTIARSQYNLDNASIRAPFSGTVLERQAQPGEFINTGNAAITLLDQYDLEIVADVPAAYIKGLTPGRVVNVRIDGKADYEATVRAVLPRETASTRTRPVRLLAPFTAQGAQPEGAQFAVGQSVSVLVPISEEREVLTVPKDALVQGRGGWIVYIAEEGKAQPRPVSVGGAVGGRFEVLGGLDEGQLVVVRGNERLQPGQDISFEMPAGMEKPETPMADAAKTEAPKADAPETTQ
ncbi:MAG: efflux transporter periplasmic adaptor subunit [Hyphomicrobiales bacterium]|nr:MAG: efflux transporter periplasmic adaptor subunit [Hyphomicrobiales bacterium]